jgi:hypothetical protein
VVGRFAQRKAEAVANSQLPKSVINVFRNRSATLGPGSLLVVYESHYIHTMTRRRPETSVPTNGRASAPIIACFSMHVSAYFLLQLRCGRLPTCTGACHELTQHTLLALLSKYPRVGLIVSGLFFCSFSPHLCLSTCITRIPSTSLARSIQTLVVHQQSAQTTAVTLHPIIIMPLSAGATIVLVIVGCGAFICCVGAMGWFYRRENPNERGTNYGWRPSNDQGDYMREIRQKNAQGLFHVARYHDRASSSQGSGSQYSGSSRTHAISAV